MKFPSESIAKTGGGLDPVLPSVNTMHPTHGGRFVLEQTHLDNDEVIYTVVFFSPQTRWDGTVRVQLRDGSISFGDFTPADAPTWLMSKTQAFLRSEWKASQRSEGAEPWPRRIQRWREE